MGLFGAIGGAVTALGSKAAEKFKSGQGDTSKPLHTHSGGDSSSKKRSPADYIATRPEDQALVGNPIGKNQVEQFTNSWDPASTDRGGKSVPGVSYSQQPAFDTPVDGPAPVDDSGMNSLIKDNLYS